MSIKWREFEKSIEKHPVFRGYKVKPQKFSHTTGLRPDIFAIKDDDSRDRIVGDAKYVKKLSCQDVDKVIRYKYPFFPKRLVIFVPSFTEIPDDVGVYAVASGVEIIEVDYQNLAGLLVAGMIFVGFLGLLLATLFGGQTATYDVTVFCKQCLRGVTVSLKKDTAREEVLKQPCPNCGVTGLLELRS